MSNQNFIDKPVGSSNMWSSNIIDQMASKAQNIISQDHYLDSENPYNEPLHLPQGQSQLQIPYTSSDKSFVTNQRTYMQGTGPFQGSFSQNQGSLAQIQGSFAQNQGSFAQNQGSLAQNQGSFAQNQGSLAQNQGSFAQNQGSFLHQGGFAQNQGSFVQTQGTFANNQEDQFLQNQGSFAKTPEGQFVNTTQSSFALNKIGMIQNTQGGPTLMHQSIPITSTIMSSSQIVQRPQSHLSQEKVIASYVQSKNNLMATPVKSKSSTLIPPLPAVNFMNHSVQIENKGASIVGQPPPIAFVTNRLISSPIKQTKKTHLTISNEFKVELEYAYFLLKIKAEELIAWKKHSKHLESHLSEGISTGGSMKLEAGALKGFEKGLITLIEENKRVLASLENQPRERAKKAGGPAPLPIHVEVSDPLQEEKNLQLGSRVKDLEGNISRLLEENKRLSIIINDKTDMVNRLEADNRGSNSSTQDRINLMNKELVRLQEVIRGKDLTLDQNNQALNRIKEELRGKASIDQEVKRLNEMLIIREKEIGEIRGRTRIESKPQVISTDEKITREYEERISSMNQQIETLKGKLRERGSENDLLKQRLSELELSLRSQGTLEAETKRLTELLAQKSQESEGFRGKVRDLEAIIQDLKRQLLNLNDLEVRVKGLTDENRDLNERLKKKEHLDPNEYKRLQDENRELKLVLDSRNNEIKDLKDRLKELEALRNQLQSKETMIKDLQFKREVTEKELLRLTESLKQTNSDFEALKLKFRGLENIASTLTLREKELEGLRQELQGRLKELGDANERVQSLSSDLNSYRSQTERKLNELVKVNEFLKKELEDSNLSMKAKDDEIKDLRNKLGNIEALKGLISKLEYDNSRLSELLKTREIELNELRNLRKDIEAKLQSKNKLFSELEIKSKLLEDSNLDLKRELDTKNPLISEYKGKLDQFSLQIKEKLGIISQKDAEIDDLKSRIAKTEGLLAQSSKFEFELKQCREILSAKEKAFIDLNARITELEIALQDSNKRYNDSILRIKLLEESLKGLKLDLEEKIANYIEIKSKYESLLFTVEEKNKIIVTLTKEISELRDKLAKLESLSAFKGQFESEIENLKALLKQKEIEINELRSKVHSLTLDTQGFASLKMDLEGRIHFLTEQNEKLKGELSGRMQLINELKQKIDSLTLSLEEKNSVIADLEKKLIFLTNSINELKTLLLEKDGIISGLQGNSSETTKKISELKRLLDEKTIELNERILIIGELEAKIAGLNADFDKKNQLLELRVREISEWRIKFNDLQSALEKKGSTLAEYENKISLLSSELNRMKNLLKNKDSELEQYKINLDSLNSQNQEQFSRSSNYEMKYQTLNNDLLKLNGSLDLRNKELADSRDKYQQLQLQFEQKNSLINDWENKYDLLRRDNERLQGLLKAKGLELEGIMKRFGDMEADFNSKLVIIRDYESRHSNSTSEQERNRELLGQRDKEISSLKITINENITKFGDLNNRILEFESKITMLQGLLKTKGLELEGIMKRFGDLEADFNSKLVIIRDYESRHSNSTSEQERNRELLGQRDKEISSLKITINEYITKFGGLNNRILEFESKITLLSGEKEGFLIRIKELEVIIVKLNKDIEDRDAKIMELQNKIAMLSGELARVKSVAERQKGEIADHLFRIQGYETSSSSMSARIIEMESQFGSIRNAHFANLELIVRMAVELEGLRGRWVEKSEQKIEETA